MATYGDNSAITETSFVDYRAAGPAVHLSDIAVYQPLKDLRPCWLILSDE
jgi:hypothetical protein